jgi:hypothetical protein
VRELTARPGSTGASYVTRELEVDEDERTALGMRVLESGEREDSAPRCPSFLPSEALLSRKMTTGPRPSASLPESLPSMPGAWWRRLRPVVRTPRWQGAVLDDPMLHVFRLGPIPIQGRSVFAYAGFGEQGPLKPQLAHSDAEGLRALAAAGGEQPLRCEPALAEAGRPFGFEPAPLPESILMARAALAYGLALGPAAGRPEPEVFASFLEACASFWRARPWELFDSIEALPATLATAGWTRSGEASVLGSGGREYGVALYDERDAIRRVASLMERGRMKESRRFDALAITFDEEPGWAASAIEDAFGLPRLPESAAAREARERLAGDRGRAARRRHPAGGGRRARRVGRRR